MKGSKSELNFTVFFFFLNEFLEFAKLKEILITTKER